MEKHKIGNNFKLCGRDKETTTYFISPQETEQAQESEKQGRIWQKELE